MPFSADPILLFAPHESPRLRYLAAVLFEAFTTIPYRVTHSKVEFLSYSGPKINYSATALAPSGGEVFLPASGLLWETGRQANRPALAEGLEWPAFFPVAAPGADLPFDLFSMAFYWLSRYEEYQPFQPDHFGRFPAAQSLGFQTQTLEYPMVDYWTGRLYSLLEQRWPGLNIPRKPYQFLPTYDIDVAWAYLHRPLWRQLLATAREVAKGQWASLGGRFRVWARAAQDPYDVYDQLNTLHLKRQLSPLYFFLLSNYSKYDPSISHRTTALRRLIRNYAAQAGLHPSIASNKIEGRLKEEKQRLESITGIPAKNCRQHYLVLRFPETYRRLEAAGFHCDYSMGFADAIGFRAGTGWPYPWYDLLQERQSTLWIQPFQVMDGTLRNYLRLSPEQGLQALLPLIQRCRETGTTFSTLWHNSSFYTAHGWEGWPEMYLLLLAEAFPGK